MKWLICCVLLCQVAEIHTAVGKTCSDSSSCKDDTLVCGDNKTCAKKCSVDTNCTVTTEKCLGKIRVCTDTLGLNCTRNTDCGTSQGCGSNRKCIATLGANCTRNLECGSSQGCRANKCVDAIGLNCTAENDCGTRQSCDGKTCQAMCVNNTDCHDPTEKCVTGMWRSYCGGTLGRTCFGQNDCAVGQACGDHLVCIEICYNDTDCTNTEKCLMKQGKMYCTEKCNNSLCNKNGVCFFKERQQECKCYKGHSGLKCENGAPAMQLSAFLSLAIISAIIF